MPTIPCPPEWITWLRESFIVPSCLVPHGGNDLLPEGVQSSSMKLFGPELGASGIFYCLLPIIHPVIDVLFQDTSSSTFTHDLLCVGEADTCKYWFMTAAKSWLEVTEHMRGREGSNTIHAYSMSPQELSQAPFVVYFHVQKKGDLVILPPRRSANSFLDTPFTKYPV